MQLIVMSMPREDREKDAADDKQALCCSETATTDSWLGHSASYGNPMMGYHVINTNETASVVASSLRGATTSTHQTWTSQDVVRDNSPDVNSNRSYSDVERGGSPSPRSLTEMSRNSNIDIHRTLLLTGEQDPGIENVVGELDSSSAVLGDPRNYRSTHSEERLFNAESVDNIGSDIEHTSEPKQELQMDKNMNISHGEHVEFYIPTALPSRVSAGAHCRCPQSCVEMHENPAVAHKSKEISNCDIVQEHSDINPDFIQATDVNTVSSSQTPTQILGTSSETVLVPPIWTPLALRENVPTHESTIVLPLPSPSLSSSTADMCLPQESECDIDLKASLVDVQHPYIRFSTHAVNNSRNVEEVAINGGGHSDSIIQEICVQGERLCVDLDCRPHTVPPGVEQEDTMWSRMLDDEVAMVTYCPEDEDDEMEVFEFNENGEDMTVVASRPVNPVAIVLESGGREHFVPVFHDIFQCTSRES